MAAFTDEEFLAHLTIHTGGVPFSNVYSGSQEKELVIGLAYQCVPIRLPAWSSEKHLSELLETKLPYLRVDCVSLRERLELFELCRTQFFLNQVIGGVSKELHEIAEDIFSWDDEEIRLKLGNLRKALTVFAPDFG